MTDNIIYNIFPAEKIPSIQRRMVELAQAKHMGEHIEHCANESHPHGLGVFKDNIIYYYNIESDRSTRAVVSPIAEYNN